MRKVLQLQIAGNRLFGTVHDNDSSSSDGIKQDSERTGTLMLSFGQQQRSWVGDLASSIADRLAEKGYPAFRFDMPGLGDSPGELPLSLEELGREVQLGSQEQLLLALCEELVRLYSLKGLVVCGNCGGAVTPLYLANARSPLVLGLILIEPEMALVQAESPATSAAPPPLTVVAYYEGMQLLWRRLTSLKSWGHLFSGKTDFSFWLRLWHGLIDFTIRKFKSLGRQSIVLPREANHRMINSWNLARRLKISTLTISVGSTLKSRYYRAYGLNPGVDDIKSRLRWIEIPNTTHGMLTGGAKDTVCKNIADWVENSYPIATL
jgi:pimeloyl-ACP methyl ester carboxylesterase